MAKAVHTPEIRADYHDAIPLNRYGLEEELAEAIFFLCSDRASYITGQILAVDGGFDAAGIGLPTLRGAAAGTASTLWRRFTATDAPAIGSSRSIRVSDKGSMTKRSALSGARSSAMASTARMVPECTTSTTSPAGNAKPAVRAGDLVDKAFAAGRAVARRRFPESAIDFAKLGDEIVVPPPGPRAKILLAEGSSSTASSPSASAVSRVRRAGLQTARACAGNRAFSAAKAAASLKIGRRIGRMDDAARAIDRRVTDQPEVCLLAHGVSRAVRRATAASRSPRPARPRPARRRSGRRSGAWQASAMPTAPQAADQRGPERVGP